MYLNRYYFEILSVSVLFAVIGSDFALYYSYHDRSIFQYA